MGAIMKILITGDAGFVGRAFHRALAKQRHEITGIDLVNGKEVRHFFATDDTQFDIVIHLAAIVGGRMTIEGNPLSVASDLAIDADMFQWALRTRPKHIVYFSSSAAYPTFLQKLDYKQKLREIDINLEHIRTPDFTYGWAKLSGEMLASYARAEGLKVTVLRPFSGYGSDQALDYPFPSFIERAKRKADPFEVWGRGTQVRDFVHIDDVVEATFAAVINDVKTMNICSGRPTSFIELAEMVMLQAKYLAPIKNNLDAPIGVEYRVGDTTRMFQVYEPKISLEEGIARALAS
jgi:nucleoside-diphosphate-sugar epimerase